MPTSCGYNIIGYDKGKQDMIASFIQWFFFTTITEKYLTSFLGWFFPHFTGVPIVINNDHVQLQNKYKNKNPVFVGAWGSSGGHDHF